MYDRLDGIKAACHAKVYGPAVSDVSWLIAEVESLRLSEATLRRDVENTRATRIADLEIIVDYCTNLVTALDKIDSINPITESLRRVTGILAKKLNNLQSGNIEDRCDPERNYHSTPHKGCILR
jgi:uncharacterized alkaline shock family protein YloU